MLIICLTGASGAGNTMLLESLRYHLHDSNIIYLKFDDIGVPEEVEMINRYGSVEAWQRAMTFKWLENIQKNYQNHKAVILDGQINLTFIKDACQHFHQVDYEIILIDCPDEVRHERLINFRNQSELVNNNMDSWAKFLREQAKLY